MQTERLAAAVTANLQHLTGGNRDSRPTAVIERILIRDDRAQRVVSATEIHHDEIAAPRALRESDVAQKRRSGKADGKCRNAVTDEFSSGNHLVK